MVRETALLGRWAAPKSAQGAPKYAAFDQKNSFSVMFSFQIWCRAEGLRGEGALLGFVSFLKERAWGFSSVITPIISAASPYAIVMSGVVMLKVGLLYGFVILSL